VADRINSNLLQNLVIKTEKLTHSLEKASIAEFIELYQKPRRMLYLSFLSGIAIGFTIVGALFLYVMGRIASLNLPIVGEFIAELTRIVQNELAIRP
jgi:preprotein translocase subunit Sss1